MTQAITAAERADALTDEQARRALRAIVLVMYPTPDHEWSAETLDKIAAALAAEGVEP